ncbi:MULTISPECIES: DUF429 domain-containing protein [Streptomyces]|uniref:DUF429 domain-containing protein n=1 Tax=Streptomyces TaxID=1883 RepID=UPI001DF22E3B|nr:MULTISPECIES: DUF429 domain-containing protein [Streptomyces]MBP2348890.1 hypothetical protein [Streptomyces virginiae]
MRRAGPAYGDGRHRPGRTLRNDRGLPPHLGTPAGRRDPGCQEQRRSVGGCADCRQTGLDSPIGWPVEFIALLTAHRAGTRLPERSRYLPHSDGRDGLRRVTHRLTDDLAWKHTGAGKQRPLSVAADKLGVVAMRAVDLPERLADEGRALPRDESGSVAEVYPAFALIQWGLASRESYKSSKPAALPARAMILDGLTEGLGLRIDTRARERCTRSDHDLDALISAVVARAVACGLTHPPMTDEERAMAAVEGWIHLPRHDLPLSAVRYGTASAPERTRPVLCWFTNSRLGRPDRQRPGSPAAAWGIRAFRRFGGHAAGCQTPAPWLACCVSEAVRETRGSGQLPRDFTAVKLSGRSRPMGQSVRPPAAAAPGAIAELAQHGPGTERSAR